jgi:hypothetical protein
MHQQKGRSITAGQMLLLTFLFCSHSVEAVSVTNIPVADASLIEVAANNNNGGQAWVLAGRTQNGPHNRGLYRFDLSNIPGNAIIQSAVLQLEVTRQPGDMSAVNSSFGLHRMLRPWGEGTNVAINIPGQGLPAVPGEVTWNYSFYPTNAWSEPGGAPDADYASIESSFQYIASPDLSPYRFENTPEMTGDAQFWVNHTESNFGWMLLGNEDVIFTSRRFNSREDPNSQPQLELVFMLPPNIDQVAKTGSNLNFSFTALPGQSYVVEYRNSLSNGTWQTLTNAGFFSETNRVQVTDPLANPQRFYRVATQ